MLLKHVWNKEMNEKSPLPSIFVLFERERNEKTNSCNIELKCPDFLFFSHSKIMLFHHHIKHLLTNQKTRNSFPIFPPTKEGTKDLMNPSFISIGWRAWGISSSIFLSQKHALTQENTFQRKNNKIKICQRVKDCNNKIIIIN